jgi:hypothetical protein
MDIANFSNLQLGQLATVTSLAGTCALAFGLPLQLSCGLSTRTIIITATWLGSLLSIAWAFLPCVQSQTLITAVVYAGALLSCDAHVLAPVIRSLFTALSLSGEVEAPVAAILGAMSTYIAAVRLWAPALGNVIYAYLVSRDRVCYGYYGAAGCALTGCVVMCTLPALGEIERKAKATLPVVEAVGAAEQEPLLTVSS